MALAAQPRARRLVRTGAALALVLAVALTATTAHVAAESAAHARLAAYKRAFDRWDRATDPLSLDIFAAMAVRRALAPEDNRTSFASLASRTQRARRRLEQMRTPSRMRRAHRKMAAGVGRIVAQLNALSAATGRSDEPAAARAADAVIAAFERSDRTELALRARLRRLLAAS